MGKLERARIHVLKGDGSPRARTSIRTSRSASIPKEYSLEKSVEWDAEKAFADAPQPEFKAPKPMSLSVTLQFDTYEERTNVRDKWVRKIEKLTMMTGDLPKDGSKASKSDKQKFRPPTILFIWGRFIFKGVVESLSQKYTMFLSDGTPVRAECALKIRNVIDKNMDDDKSQSFTAPGQRQVVPGSAGRSARSHRRHAARRRRSLGRDRRHATTSSMPATSRMRRRPQNVTHAARGLSRGVDADRLQRQARHQRAHRATRCTTCSSSADLDQPDHGIVTLSNLSTKYSEQITEGDDLEVKLGFVDGEDQGTVFKGEVVGIEPIYDARSPARVHIRGSTSCIA